MKKSGQLINKKKKGPSGGNKVKSPNQSGVINAPVASTSRVRASKPRITTLANGDMRVHHREFVLDLLGSVAYTSTSIAINPGQTVLFPWLSMIAQRYESYRFKSLRFCLDTVAPTTATGSILMAVDYDATDDAPTSKVQAMSYRSSVRAAPWVDLEFVPQSEDLHKLPSNFVRDVLTLPANRDLKLYDIGNLYLITQGQASTAQVSELYVEYDVELITPQLGPLGSGTEIGGSAGLSGTVGFGSNWALDADSTVPVTIDATGTTLTFLSAFSGTVIYNLIGTVITAVATVGSTCSITPSVISAGTNNSCYVVVFYCTAAAGQTLTIQSTATTRTQMYLFLLSGNTKLFI
jgi:hypothetical protein